MKNSSFFDKILWSCYRVKRRWRCLFSFLRDGIRYYRYSSTLELKYTYPQLEALIIKQYHAIEKGFNMPQCKTTFGITHADKLLKWMSLYQENGYDENNMCFQQALNTLKYYLDYHDGREEYLKDIYPKITEKLREFSAILPPPICIYNKDALFSKERSFQFRSLVLSRHSSRMFTGEPVPDDLVNAALDLARHAPSSCNRQPWRVTRIRNTDRIKILCSLQQGNRGFGHLAGEMLIITSDISAFRGAQERNQAYIDGGIFSMSLLLSLHNEGLGACALNWSASAHADHELRKVFRIPDEEVVVMCIAVGILPDTFHVARSLKHPVQHFVRNDSK